MDDHRDPDENVVSNPVPRVGDRVEVLTRPGSDRWGTIISCSDTGNTWLVRNNAGGTWEVAPDSLRKAARLQRVPPRSTSKNGSHWPLTTDPHPSEAAAPSDPVTQDAATPKVMSISTAAPFGGTDEVIIRPISNP